MSERVRYLLDTNIASFILNGRSQSARNLFHRAENQAFTAISTVTQAEILFGLAKKPQALRVRVLAQELFATLPILPWDSAAAIAYAQLRATLNASGKNLSVLDLQIASHALSINATLITHDRAFSHLVPHLQVQDWATDL